MLDGVSWSGIAQFAIICAMISAFVWVCFWRSTQPRNAGMVQDRPVGAAYHVYTRAFDQCLHARELLNVIGKISPDVHRGFAGRDDDDWHENIVAFEDVTHRGAANFDDLKFDRWPEFAITFLVDQSGSLKDDRLIDSIRAVWEVVSWLTAEGAAVEVLGFTTAGWHGGFARDE